MVEPVKLVPRLLMMGDHGHCDEDRTLTEAQRGHHNLSGGDPSVFATGVIKTSEIVSAARGSAGWRILHFSQHIDWLLMVSAA